MAEHRPLPSHTPITDMVPPEAAATLTPGAKKLTKAELTELLFARATPQELNLQVADLRSVNQAFKAQWARNLAGRAPGEMAMASGDIKCCCCPCCCCSAASSGEMPLRRIA